MIAAGIEEDVPADWPGFHSAYLALVGRIPRTATRLELEPLAEELGVLSDEIGKVLEDHVKNRIRAPMSLNLSVIYRLWCAIRVVGAERSLDALSGDALRHRHTEPGHPVEHRAADPGFGLLGRQRPGADHDR